MKNLFVPYEIAVLAKKKGFDKPCLACYAKRCNGENYLHISNIGENELYGLENINMDEDNEMYVCKIDSECSLAPLYQELVDWFRVNHKMWIQVDTEFIHGTEIYVGRISGAHVLDICTDGENEYYTMFNDTLERAFKLI